MLTKADINECKDAVEIDHSINFTNKVDCQRPNKLLFLTDRKL